MDIHEIQRELNRRVERELSRLEQQIDQRLAERLAILGRQQNPRLARTVADAEEDPIYPAEDSGANVFPIVFLSGGFTHTAGVQVGQYNQHRETPQAKVFCLHGRYLPEGTVIQVWHDPGVDPTYKGKWWTDSPLCLPPHLSRGVRISGSQLIDDRWFTYAPCDEYVPYVIADLDTCFYSPYTPDDTPEIWFNGEDTYDGWTGWDDEPDPGPWTKFDGAAYFIPDSYANVEYCIELPITIEAAGGFFQFDWIIPVDLTTAGVGPLVCKVDGVEVWSETEVGGGTAGPFVLTPGEHTISFCLDYATPSVEDSLAKVENFTVWGTE